MSLVVTFRLPVAKARQIVQSYGTPLSDTTHIRAQIKNAIGLALDSNLPLSPSSISPGEATERVNVSFPKEQAEKIYAIADEFGIEESEVCRRLAMAYAEQGNLSSGNIALAANSVIEEFWCASPTRQRRSEQAQTYLNLVAAFEASKVSMTEAATGTGKTLAMIAAGEAFLRSHEGERCCIAVPTVALIHQFAASYAEVVKSGVAIHPLRCIFGRREFVSPDDLYELAQNPKYIDYREKLIDWIVQGGKPLPESSIKQSWLTETVLQIAPDFPVESCNLSDAIDPNNPAEKTYRAQFERRENDPGEILICTHAMIAVSTKTKMFSANRHDEVGAMRAMEKNTREKIKKIEDKEHRRTQFNSLEESVLARIKLSAEVSFDCGILPEFSYLMIDEAHTFESNVSLANSSCVSLCSLSRLAKQIHQMGGGLSASRVKTIDQAISEISSLFSAEEIVLDGSSPNSERIIQQLNAIAEALTPRKEKHVGKAIVLWRRVAIERSILARACKGRQQRAMLRYSPIRAYPQLVCGSETVDSIMGFLWASTKAVSCVSATLYLRRQNGVTAAYQRLILNIPEQRSLEQAPVAPPWLYECVEGIWTPSELTMRPSGGIWLRPPTRSDRLNRDEYLLAESSWLDDVAMALQDIYSSSAGGVLVLMTSYDNVAKLALRLQTNTKIALVSATPDSKISEQVRAFLKLTHSGQKPMWLAVGAAWTGIDVGGHEPWAKLFGTKMASEVDNVMTDLIIPRIPYRVNRSITHEFRMRSRPGVPWEQLDTMFRLRQGIGRAVRRDSLPANRRFFILDARLCERHFGSMRAYIDNALQPYKRLPGNTIKPKFL